MTNYSEAAAGAGEPVVALVPRVDIHVFCADTRTASIMQAAAVDRRLSRAHVDIKLGGVQTAVQIYSQSQTPAVVLVECLGQREQILAELEALAGVCDPNSKVIVIGHVNDVVLYRELIRQGVSEYLVAPLHQLQVIEAIGNLFHGEKAGPVGRIIAFVGSKGGVGSSTLAHNVGWLLSRNFSIDTVITDLDLSFGTAGLNFNQESAQGIADALSSPDRVDPTLLDRLLTKCSDRLSLLASPGSIDREVTIDPEAVEHILDVVRGNVPCVVVDVPNIWAPWTKLVLTQADEVVITATPELACLRNAKNLIDFLKAARPNDRAPRLVLNQVGVVKRPEIPVADFGKAVGVEPSVVINFDPQVFGTAGSNGQMIAEVNAKSKSAEAIERLAQLLSGRDPVRKQSNSLFAPFMKKLGKK